MRADQHKEKSSKKIVYILILIVVLVIGFIGYKSISGNSFFGKASVSKTEKTTTELASKTPADGIKDEDIKKLAKAMEEVTGLYTDQGLETFRDNLTKNDIDNASKRVEKLDKKVKAKKELQGRIKDAQKFVETQKSN